MKGTGGRPVDEVSMFPSLDMAVPRDAPLLLAGAATAGRKSGSRGGKLRVKTTLPSGAPPVSVLPGLLKTSKPLIEQGRMPNADDFLAFVGFNASHVYFDGATIRPAPPRAAQAKESEEPKHSVIDLALQALIDDSPPASPQTVGPSGDQSPHSHPGDSPNKSKRGVTGAAAAGAKRGSSDPVVDELRNYTSLLDQFSLHNFMIYNGQTLRDTPEFQSFRRTYNHEWGSIAVIITMLEKLLREHSVKLAIINGPSLYDLASLNLVAVERDELIMCISNIDQVGPQLKSLYGNDSGGGPKDETDEMMHKGKSATICQALVRRFLATRRVKRLRGRIAAAVHIQSVTRRRIYRRVGIDRMRTNAALNEDRWNANREALSRLWRGLNVDTSSSSAATSATQKRLVIHIPSITAAEYLRIDMDNIRAIQNAAIGCLPMLADPDVTLVYVTPCAFGPSEIAYHDKFLSLLGISTLPKRLHFIVPEMLPRFPEHMPLSQVLWSSPAALRKIKQHVRRIPNAFILPGCVSWAEKKIALALDVPLLAPNPTVAETIRSRSYSKRIFTAACVNIPVGAHDIYTLDDFLVALTRLVACNLHVRRWILRLNYDFNNESCAVLDTNKIALVGTLREEQKLLFESTNNQTGSWYTKNVQLSVRKRLLEALTVEVPNKIVICRKDLHGNWDKYLRLASRVGMVIEADPLDRLGYVESLAFIDPLGAISLHGGADVIVDDKLQSQTLVSPQSLTPNAALEGATRAVATHLYERFGVIGHVTVKFCAFWDALDKIPRLWGVGLGLGLSSQFGAATTVAIAVEPAAPVPRSLLPPLPVQGKYTVHIPVAIHEQLRGSRDDVFFKLCRMRGLAFDPVERVGVLFFLVDTVVGGAISFVVVANSRFRALEHALQCLSFVATQFGKDRGNGAGVFDCRNLCSILLYLRRAYKAEEKQVGFL